MSEPSQSPSEGHRNESVLGPFTVRDLTLFGGVLITFVGSLLPLLARNAPTNLWNGLNLYFVAIGFLVPAAAATLFAWRRLEPARTLRIGSLSVDQFASVTAVLCASFYFIMTVTTLTPGAVVGLLGGLAMLAATTLARLIPPFAGEFELRPEAVAHVTARDAVPTARRPRASAGAGGWAGAEHLDAAGPGVGAGSAGAAAGAAGAAAGAAAWAGHSVWSGDGAQRPGEAAAVPGAGPASGGPVGPVDEPASRFAEPGVPSADDVARAEDATPADDAVPAEVGAADLLDPAPPVEPTTTAAVPAGAAGPASGDATALHDRASETGAPEPVEPTVPAGFGDADGEMYGAPETVADASAGPATAVFPSSTGAPRPRAGAAPSGDDIGATKPYDDDGQYEAFWFAVSEPRTAVDPTSGRPVFALEPGQWILALQDRGREFVVQSPDGRIGVLRELSGIERG